LQCLNTLGFSDLTVATYLPDLLSILVYLYSLYMHIPFFSNLTNFNFEKPSRQVLWEIYSIILCSKLKTILQNSLKVYEKLDLNCSLVRLSFSHPIYLFFWSMTVLLLGVKDQMFVIVKNLLVLVIRRNQILWLWVLET
jgi:hypothetical protein